MFSISAHCQRKLNGQKGISHQKLSILHKQECLGKLLCSVSEWVENIRQWLNTYSCFSSMSLVDTS